MTKPIFLSGEALEIVKEIQKQAEQHNENLDAIQKEVMEEIDFLEEAHKAKMSELWQRLHVATGTKADENQSWEIDLEYFEAHGHAYLKSYEEEKKSDFADALEDFLARKR